MIIWTQVPLEDIGDPEGIRKVTPCLALRQKMNSKGLGNHNNVVRPPSISPDLSSLSS
jgi:hypothetical protein